VGAPQGRLLGPFLQFIASLTTPKQVVEVEGIISAMKASVIGLALLWGIAAHAQQPAPTKTTELQARSYILSAFVTGAAASIMAPTATVTQALRDRLKVAADADLAKVYDAIVQATSDAKMTVRPARAEEAVKAGALTGIRKPLYAVVSGESLFVVQYELDSDQIVFAGDASPEPKPPARVATEKPVETPVAPPKPVAQEALPPVAAPSTSTAPSTSSAAPAAAAAASVAAGVIASAPAPVPVTPPPAPAPEPMAIPEPKP
jgi:hypothetical protein